jgi:hypothetical protein
VFRIFLHLDEADAYSAVPCILVLYGRRIRARSAIAKVDRNNPTSFHLLLIETLDLDLNVDDRSDLGACSYTSTQITLFKPGLDIGGRV